MAQQTGTGIATILNVAVPVADPARALEFYVGTLGFEKRRDMPFGDGYRWMEVAPAGTTTNIALVFAPGGDVQPGVDTGIRLGTTDCDASHRALRESGVDVDAEVMRWPGVPPMFTFRDPDGNTLYVVEG